MGTTVDGDKDSTPCDLVEARSLPVCPDQGQAGALRRELLFDRPGDVLGLDDIRRVGMAFFGQPEAIALFGQPAGRWYAAGARLTGAMCVQATVDLHSTHIAKVVRRCLERLPDLGAVGVVDLFAGSCNLGFHISRELGAISCVGIENNRQVVELTRANLTALRVPYRQLRHAVWPQYFEDQLAEVDTTVFVLDPPWGKAFSFTNGLDLRNTRPPVMELFQHITRHDQAPRRYCVLRTPVHEPVDPDSLRPLVNEYRLMSSAPGCLIFDLTQGISRHH